jgi:Domain of unknown function (DUF4340)
MKLRDLLIAAVLLALLLGVLYWSNHRKPSEDAAVKASSDAPVKILSLNQADITRLSIQRKDQPRVDLVRNDLGVWRITAPKAFETDQGAVSRVLSTLSSLNSDRLLDPKASDPASYGLTLPPLELELTLKDNKTQKLFIGDPTPSGTAYYVMLAGDPRLFTLASYEKTNLDKTAGDLRDKRLFTSDFDKVSEIELVATKPGKNLGITFARSKDAWQILKPRPLRADSGQVDELVRALREAKVEIAPADDDAKSAASFRSASPFAIVKITGTSGTQELDLRKDKSEYYAKSSAQSGIYKVAATLGTALDKSLDDFRDKELFDFGSTDPNKIEINDGSKSYFLTRSDSDWFGPDGKKLDESTVQDLLSKIRDFSAEKFSDSGFTAPLLRLTVFSNDSKRLEKVLVAKNGDTYIAKRESEPSLYEISASRVTALEESAAAVKPAATAKK